MADEEARDFLFTWKADNWPYEKLKVLIDRFKGGETVIEPWRCKSHRQVRAGAKGYLYKQGDPPNGIFGIAQATDQAIPRTAIQEGESEYEVPLRFELLLDPNGNRFIMTKEQLQLLPQQVHLNTQSSGISLPGPIARAIDVVAERDFHDLLRQTSRRLGPDPLPPAKRERLTEVYERDQSIVDELKRLYSGRCQFVTRCHSMGYSEILWRAIILNGCLAAAWMSATTSCSFVPIITRPFTQLIPHSTRRNWSSDLAQRPSLLEWSTT